MVEHVDDPRFALLTAREPSEHGLRIDPATGRVPPPPPAPPAAPVVVQAPARDRVARDRVAGDRVARDRRRAGRLAIAALMLPIVVAAAIGIVMWLQSDSGGSPPAPAVSPRPPAFTVSTTVAATAPAPNGIAVAAAGNGGLWYQATGGAVTRLAATDGSVNYSFGSARPALGLAVSGRLAAVAGERLRGRRAGLPRPRLRPGAVAPAAARRRRLLDSSHACAPLVAERPDLGGAGRRRCPHRQSAGHPHPGDRRARDRRQQHGGCGR